MALTLPELVAQAAGIAIAAIPALRVAVRLEARAAAAELVSCLPCRSNGARPPSPPGVNGGPPCT